LAAFFIGENMTLNLTESKRTVVLEIQTIDANQPERNCAGSAGTGIIIAIGVIVDDGMEITEDSFSNASEIDLLRGFWHVVRSHDVFVGYGIAKDLAFLRQRSWEVGLIPSLEIDLNTVYQHETLDPGSLGVIADDREYSDAEALVYLFCPRGRPRR
jgi:hypothetical protein